MLRIGLIPTARACCLPGNDNKRRLLFGPGRSETEELPGNQIITTCAAGYKNAGQLLLHTALSALTENPAQAASPVGRAPTRGACSPLPTTASRGRGT